MTSFVIQKNLSFKCSPWLSPPPADPISSPFFSGKRIRTNRQLLATQGFSDLSIAIRAHIFGPCPAKRCGRENFLRHAGSLLSWLYPRYLLPRHHLHAEAGGERRGEFPLRCSSALTAPDSRMGHGLGQTGTLKTNYPKKFIKQEQSHGNSTNFCGFGAPRGIRPPAFESVACLAVSASVFRSAQNSFLGTSSGFYAGLSVVSTEKFPVLGQIMGQAQNQLLKNYIAINKEVCKDFLYKF